METILLMGMYIKVLGVLLNFWTSQGSMEGIFDLSFKKYSPLQAHLKDQFYQMTK